jgi:hypothetical protein
MTLGNSDHTSRLEHRIGIRGKAVKQAIGYVALIVRDYDEAIEFYTPTLDFVLVEDTYIEAQSKRWVLLSPPRGERGGICCS